MAQTALITGASVGIGLELARLMAKDGYRLVLVARDEKRLNEVAVELRKLGAEEVRLLPADLAQASSCERIFRELGDARIEIDVLINNAGFGVQGEFAVADMQRQLDLLQVNITSLVHLTRLLLPGMLERGRGKVMNVASIAGFVPGPLMSCYFASKAFVVSFSLALSEECRGRGVGVTCVCPGPTRTEFFTRAGFDDSGLASSAMMTALSVAQIGYRAMLRGKALSVTGFGNQLVVQATRLAPRSWMARAVAKRNRMRTPK